MAAVIAFVSLSNMASVTTNLPVQEYRDVQKAVQEERVTWDPAKLVVNTQYAEGEFVYGGRRYHLKEEYEVHTTLLLLES